MKMGVLLLVVLLGGTAVLRAAPGGAVLESQRDIPVAYDVDVLVVGGSTGAVAAAVAAAKGGAKVFLATPRVYLGDDMTAALRLWLEEGEVPTAPLARKIFAPADQVQPIEFDGKQLIPFTYTTDLKPSAQHSDTVERTLLRDGLWGRANRESVQYDGDVTVTVTLKEAREVDKFLVMAYHRKDYHVASVAGYASADGTTWEKLAEVENKYPPIASDDASPALPFAIPVGKKVKQLKFTVKRADGHVRILLGEVLVLAPGGAQVKPPEPPGKYATRATPFHIKKTLDDALLEAGVPFLLQCYATDVLRDADGKPCGIVMANRAGRQAVRAKVIIDATDRGTVARLAGASFRPYPAGKQTFTRVVIGGEAQQAEGMTVREVGPPWGRIPMPKWKGNSSGGGMHQTYEYTLSLDMPDASYASFARADQIARDKTYHEDQQFTSDGLFQIPPDPVHAQASSDAAWPGADKLDLACLQPRGLPNVYVLGGCADISREAAAKLLRPLALMDVGTRVGQAAARQAAGAAAPTGAHVPGGQLAQPAATGEVREQLVGVRGQTNLPTVPRQAGPLPVLGTYDVVVIGGGTGGAPAAIAAGRAGAKTLCVEYHYGLGGVGTLGAISSYYHGYRGGFTAEVPGTSNWKIEQRMEWWRNEIRKAGGDIWFGSLGCGALVADGTIRGAVVATPEGRGVVLAKVVIDGTGNADVAADAGVPCIYTDASFIALQGTGLPFRALGRSYTNTDFTIVDEIDMLDVWQVYTYAKRKYARGNPFEMGKLIDTRERRRVVGEYTISILDQVTQRTFPDTVAISKTNFDTHGYTVHPLFELNHPDKRLSYTTNIPYRSILPKGLDNLLVIGLGMSVHRDAVPLIRMQPDVQNLGYAAGRAAAMAAAGPGSVRKIDLKKLQQHLVDTKCVPERVLTDKDSFPPSASVVEQAVKDAAKGYNGSAVILANPKQALPLVRQAYQQAATAEERLTYAHILAVLGDKAGLDTLLETIANAPDLGKGWRYRGMGQFGGNMSHLDKIMVAMARLGDKRATPLVIQKMKALQAESPFSHFRAVALALEALNDPAAKDAIVELLNKPGMMGYAATSRVEAVNRGGAVANANDTTRRANALRELLLARALYRLGDEDGLGKQILQDYTKDLRGHLARHAKAVLSEKKK